MEHDHEPDSEIYPCEKNTSAVIEESEHWSLNEGSMIERISDLDCLFNGLISVCLRQMLSIPKGNLR